MKNCEDCSIPVRRGSLCIDCQASRAAAAARAYAEQGLRRLVELRRRLAEWKRGGAGV